MFTLFAPNTNKQNSVNIIPFIHITMLHKKYLYTVLFLFLAINGIAQTVEDLKAPLTFYITNDMGRNGYYKQKPVAELMGEVAEIVKPECVIAAGDTHHFWGVQSTSDPLWMTNYEQIFSHPNLMLPWYPICGNHEYRGNTQAVIDYSDVSRRWMMPSKYYTKVFTKKNLSVRLVWIDTTPLINRYRENTEKYPDAVKQDIQTQMEWLENTLKNAKEKWVVVIGHHPIHAETDKSMEEQTNMQEHVDRILKKYHVDMYVCGHVHNFQHIRVKDSKIDYVVNSSESLAREVNPIEGTKFCSPDEGFSVLSASDKELVLSMINYEGKVIYQVKR